MNRLRWIFTISSIIKEAACFDSGTTQYVSLIVDQKLKGGFRVGRDLKISFRLFEIHTLLPLRQTDARNSILCKDQLSQQFGMLSEFHLKPGHPTERPSSQGSYPAFRKSHLTFSAISDSAIIPATP